MMVDLSAMLCMGMHGFNLSASRTLTLNEAEAIHGTGATHVTTQSASLDPERQLRHNLRCEMGVRRHQDTLLGTTPDTNCYAMRCNTAATVGTTYAADVHHRTGQCTVILSAEGDCRRKIAERPGDHWPVSACLEHKRTQCTPRSAPTPVGVMQAFTGW